MKSLIYRLSLVILATILFEPAAWAQGMLQLHPVGPQTDVAPPITPRVLGFTKATLLKHRLKVEIDGTVARTFVDQTFFNPTSRRSEGTYLFAFPKDAAISDFAMYIDGKKMKAELLEKDKAHKIYTDIVRKLLDPALLEYVGRNLVKVRIFPIEPRSEKRIELEYTQLLPMDGNMFAYEYPLVEGMPIGEMVIDGHIKSAIPINTVYSPTFPLDISRSGEGEFRFSFEENNFQPGSDLSLYYSVTQDDVGISLLAFREGSDEGYFMLLAAPSPQMDEDEILPKDVTFVVDTSGSMSGEKIQQVRNALRFCVQSLRDEDRFNLLPFSTEVRPLFDGPVPVNADNRRAGLEFIDNLEARGGTNISDALSAALKGIDDGDRPHLIIFLTDGLPTIGVTDIKQILKGVRTANARSIRIFAFGVGHDVNTHLLDQLADTTRAVSTYVHPGEDIEVKVSSLYGKVSRPVLANLNLSIDGVRTSDIYPKKLPDLFEGSRLVLLGRYKGSGDAHIRLDGHVRGDDRQFEYDITFPDDSEDPQFLPHLWATRKVGYLMDEIRLHGENKELKEEIIRLGRQFGIVTPYTSFLVLEDDALPRPVPMEGAAGRGLTRLGGLGGGGFSADFLGAGGQSGDSDRMLELFEVPSTEELSALGVALPLASPSSLAAGIRNAPVAVSGFEAVTFSRKLAAMKDLDEAQRVKLPGGIKRIGSRTFQLAGGKWVETTFKPGTKTTELQYGSEKYFELLTKHTDLGKVFALGKKVIFKLDRKWYEITEN